MATYKINDYINELLNEDPVTGMLGYGIGRLGKKPERKEERGSQQGSQQQQQTTGNVTGGSANTTGGNITTTGSGNINASQRMGDQTFNPVINIATGSGNQQTGGSVGKLTDRARGLGMDDFDGKPESGKPKPKQPAPEAMPQPKPKPEPKPEDTKPEAKPETPPSFDDLFPQRPKPGTVGPYDQSGEDGNIIPGQKPRPGYEGIGDIKPKPAPQRPAPAPIAPAPRPRPVPVPDRDDTKPPVFNPGTFGQNPFAQPGPGQTRGPRRRPIPPPSFPSGGGDFFPMESLSLDSRRRGVREVYSSGLDVVLSTINERRREERGSQQRQTTGNVTGGSANTTGGNVTTSGSGNINANQRMGDQTMNPIMNIATGSGNRQTGGDYIQPAPQQPAPAPAPKPRPMPKPTPVPPGGIYDPMPMPRPGFPMPGGPIRPPMRPGFPMPGGPAPAPKPLGPGEGKPMEPGRPGKPKPKPDSGMYKPDPRLIGLGRGPLGPEEIDAIRELLRPKPIMQPMFGRGRAY